jgi:hypothetical protein
LRLALVIPAAFLGAAIAMRLLLAHAPSYAQTGLAQPLPVATGWNAFGAALLGALLIALATSTLAYERIVKSRGPAAFRSPFALAALVAVVLACAWSVPVVFSSDVYAYAAYGELARLGTNPYGHVLLPARDAIFDAAVVQWGNPPPTCVYGPAFVWVAAGIVGAAAPFGVFVALSGLRLFSVGALIACTLLAYVAYGGDRAQRLLAAATVGLNPVVIWSAAEGHNDAVVLAVVLAGYACARRGLTAVGAFVACCSGAIKLPGVVAGLPLALASVRARAGAVGGALAALAFSAPVFLALAGTVAPHARYAPQASFQAIVEPIAAAFFRNEARASLTAWGLAAIAAAAFALAAIRALRLRDARGWAYLAAGGWLLVPNPYPWYSIWLVAIAAAVPGSRAGAVLLWLAIASLLRYAPDAIGTPSPLVAALLGIAATLPLLWLPWPTKSSAIINGSS